MGIPIAVVTGDSDVSSRNSRFDRAFFSRPAVELARDLLGKVLVHRWRGRDYRVRIVEAEAYVGPHDLACHAAKGRTRRTEVMFGPGGHAYVYLVYGMYEMFNVVASVDGDAQAVLIRAGEPIGWDADLSGPGKLTRAMHIGRTLNGADLTGDVLFLSNAGARMPKHIVTARRIGVDYAKEWKDAMLRFYDADSKAVSKPR
jgi:DNA-3-methyladenine glycosylase